MITAKMQEFNREEFLESKLFLSIKVCVCLLDCVCLLEEDIVNGNPSYLAHISEWRAYQKALKFITGKEYFFTRTDECYGICTEDEKDWLYYVGRRLDA